MFNCLPNRYMIKQYLAVFLFLTILVEATLAQDKLDLTDIFNLEWVSDAQISPDGSRVVYVRSYNDIMADRNYANLWIVNVDGSDNRPLTTGHQNDFAPQWTHDGRRVLYKSNKDGSTQLYLRWLDNGTEARLTNLTRGFGYFQESPDGRWIAFSQFVEASATPFVKLPVAPAGAHWATPPKFIDQQNYRMDGAGYLKEGRDQLFIISTDGGVPIQITDDTYDIQGGFTWTPDSQYLIFTGNRPDDEPYERRNTELYQIHISSHETQPLTARHGPDESPAVSPNGKYIAYLGFDEQYKGHQTSRLYVMDRDGQNAHPVETGLDRDIQNLYWSGDSKGLYFQYDDAGDTWIAYTTLRGDVTKLAQAVGGLSLGRPYSGGTYSITANGVFAFTHATPDHPADLATGRKGGSVTRITHLNADLFSQKNLGKVEEIWFESSYDQRKVQGWICYPPDFDPAKKYPLMLEIHGGPYANYGNRFSAEIQLYAAKGYVVLYTNPRGSTGYGEAFTDLIYQNYPGQDFDDLMSGVDALIDRGFVDTNNLFVTGGSGGGVLTAWIVGHTQRFRAAVVAKPVINWYSFVLYSDFPDVFYKQWFPGLPWDNLEHYMKRSPISYVGNVTTPTMLLTGEQDYRTPISETEQYYAALKLNGVETAMVRIQESGHGIAARPSNLVAKVAYILGWFEKYRTYPGVLKDTGE